MLKRARKFAKNRDGLAAVEFGLIAPVLVTLLLGTAEVCNALECHTKVTLLASTASDLVSQESSVSATDMTNIFDATTSILYPFPTNNAKIIITSIVSDGNGGGTVAWSVAQNATAHTANAAIVIPSGLMTKSSCAVNACSVILAEVTYAYTSPMGKFILGTVNMTDIFYSHPRKSTAVSYTG
jgi:Flp pilus assembly protein TadG